MGWISIDVFLRISDKTDEEDVVYSDVRVVVKSTRQTRTKT